MTQTDRDRKPRGKGPKRPRKPKVDPFAIGELEITDYKDVKMLRRFVDYQLHTKLKSVVFLEKMGFN